MARHAFQFALRTTLFRYLHLRRPFRLLLFLLFRLLLNVVVVVVVVVVAVVNWPSRFVIALGHR